MISDGELKWCTEQYTDMILRIAVSYFGSIDEAQDILQEVFLRLIQQNKLFADEEHRKRWLIRVTSNLCRNERKSSYRRRVILVDNDASEMIGRSTEYQNGDSDESEKLRDAVTGLPENLRIVVHLFYYEAYPVKDIASMLNKSEAAVQMRLYRARAVLKKKLKGGWADGRSGTE